MENHSKMSESRKFFGNSLSILLVRLMQAITTFILTAAIARTLGAEMLGQYLLAFSYYYIFMSIASQGLKTFLTRELSRSPGGIPAYLVQGSLLQVIFSSIAYLTLVLIISILPYDFDTKLICYIMGLMIFPFSLSNITESIFQAQERMHLIAVSTVPVYVFRLAIMLWAVSQQYHVKNLAGVMVISESLVLFVEWFFLAPKLKLKWKIKWDFIWSAVNASRTFIAIEAAGIVANKTQILILSLLGSAPLVGIYGGIEQLMQPFYIICNSILLASFPKMSKTVKLGIKNQRQFTQSLIEILLCVAIPLLVGILFFGDNLLIFVFKDPVFSQAFTPLKIVALSLIPTAVFRTLGYLLLANGFEKINLFEVVMATSLGGIFGIILIPRYVLIGAAYVTLLMSVASTIIFALVVQKKLFLLNLWKVTIRPLSLSVMMIPVFSTLRRGEHNFLLVLLVSVSIYTLLASLIIVHSLGGVRAAYGKAMKKNTYE